MQCHAKMPIHFTDTGWNMCTKKRVTLSWQYILFKLVVENKAFSQSQQQKNMPTSISTMVIGLILFMPFTKALGFKACPSLVVDTKVKRLQFCTAFNMKLMEDSKKSVSLSPFQPLLTLNKQQNIFSQQEQLTLLSGAAVCMCSSGLQCCC